MKLFKILFLLIFPVICQTAFAQTVKSSITIKIRNGAFVVSGIVSKDDVKNTVIEKVKNRLGDKTDYSRLSVQPNAEPFQTGWEIEFDNSLVKIKGWKSGVFVFSADKNQKLYPLLPNEITKLPIALSDGKTVTLKNQKNKMVVLFFLASWCGPCRNQAESLRDFYPQIASRNVEIIGIGADNDESEKEAIPKLFKMLNLPFKYGWTNDEMLRYFAKISKLNGIPQAVIILNERFYGIFAGGSPKVDAALKETILKIADENNL